MVQAPVLETKVEAGRRRIVDDDVRRRRRAVVGDGDREGDGRPAAVAGPLFVTARSATRGAGDGVVAVALLFAVFDRPSSC